MHKNILFYLFWLGLLVNANAQSQFIGINDLAISRDTSTLMLFMTGEAHGYSSNHSVEAAYINTLVLIIM